MYNKQASINSMQKTSDQEIRGTKEALIQDLEKKLRCKDNLLQNGNQVREICWLKNQFALTLGSASRDAETSSSAPEAGASKLSWKQKETQEQHCPNTFTQNLNRSQQELFETFMTRISFQCEVADFFPLEM